MLVTILAILYGGMFIVAFLNAGLMPRPTGSATVDFELMIPARNEAHNLPTVLPPLIDAGAKVTIYDDGSTDDTASVARQLGAIVVEGSEALPAGWKGKNFACQQLADRATADWVVFLDADTKPSHDFVPKLSSYLANCKTPVVTGFASMIPGEGIEPLYLSWVPWILLATNPFALVSLTGKAHNRFTNGQFTVWRREVLQDLRPNEALKSEILEDVKIGRLLAAKRIPVTVLNVTSILHVRMYRTLREAFDGMSKNSGDIVGNPLGSWLLAIGLLLLAWGWAFTGKSAIWLYLILAAGKLLTDRSVKAPIWLWPFVPISISMATITIIRSLYWKKRGAVRWKGRIY